MVDPGLLILSFTRDVRVLRRQKEELEHILKALSTSVVSTKEQVKAAAAEIASMAHEARTLLDTVHSEADSAHTRSLIASLSPAQLPPRRLHTPHHQDGSMSPLSQRLPVWPETED